MGKVKYILLFLFFGIFWNPLNSYACGENATKPKKEHSQKEKHAKQNCCKKKHTSGHSENEDCKSKCNCPTYCFNASIPSFYEIKVEKVYLPLQKYNFIFREACLSTGFHSIWLPPKIN